MNYKAEKCQCCLGMKYTIERRRMNTQYNDDESNFIESCIECYAESVEYYAERWAEYYSGCM